MSPRSSEGTSPIWIEERVQVERFRAGLLSFFARSSRDLPWRRNPNPYRVLVSEVMLQQTRVDTVIPYFERWMDRFPTLETLAAAELDDLLVLWKGLGYYSRARRLHETVREISRRYEGEIPSDPVLLGALPGIGGYTAGAVASIAFGVPAPAVDGNVRRVFSRLFDRGAPTPSELQRWGALLVDAPRSRPGRWRSGPWPSLGGPRPRRRGVLSSSSSAGEIRACSSSGGARTGGFWPECGSSLTS